MKALDKSRKEMFKILCRQSITLVSELLEPSLFSSLIQDKAGLVFWMIEISKKIDGLTSVIGQENAEKYKLVYDRDDSVNHSGHVCRAVLSKWTERGMTLGDVLASKLKAVTASNDTVKGKGGRNAQSVPTPSSSSPTSGPPTSFSSIPTLTCKILGAMQSLPKVNADIKAEVFAAISILPIDTLSMLSMSGPMSKATLDAFFENCKDSQLVTQVINTLAPKMATLGGHYIGQHIVKRIFETTSVQNKEKILKLLLEGKDYLLRSKEGRNSARITGLDLYQRNEKEWKNSLIRQERATAMVAELEGEFDEHLKDNTKQSKKKKKIHDGDDDIDNNKEDELDNVTKEAGKVKRKRKRNRGGGDSSKNTKITF